MLIGVNEWGIHIDFSVPHPGRGRHSKVKEKREIRSMKNEIGLLEENIESLIGQQLHLEITDQGVYDYNVTKLFVQDGRLYLFATRISPEKEGYLMRIEELGDGWWTIVDIEDDTEWERVRSASGCEDYTTVVHR
jgi:hypothetical protein